MAIKASALLYGCTAIRKGATSPQAKRDIEVDNANPQDAFKKPRRRITFPAKNNLIVVNYSMIAMYLQTYAFSITATQIA